MAHKKTQKGNLDNADKTSDKMDTFVRDFRNAVETRVRSMEDMLEQSILKIESHFNLKKTQIPQEILQMKFVDYIECEGKKTMKTAGLEGMSTKAKTGRKKAKAPATSKKTKASSKTSTKNVDDDGDKVTQDAPTCNLLDMLKKQNINLNDIPLEFAGQFMESLKQFQGKANVPREEDGDDDDDDDDS